jgi:hypothetical protein
MAYICIFVLLSPAQNSFPCCFFQENICLENGSYLLNFAGCSQCKKKEPIAVENRVKDESEDGQEAVTYQRKISIYSSDPSWPKKLMCQHRQCQGYF